MNNIAALNRNPNNTHYTCKCCGSNVFEMRHFWDVGTHWNQCSVPLAVWDCLDCKLTFLYPIPESDQYPGGGDWFSPNLKDLSRKYWFKTLRRKLIDKYFGTKAERFLRGFLKIKPNGRFLDIGCGTGNMLELASQYYEECVGVEPSPIAARIARDKGFRIHENYLDSAKLEKNYYDVILMDSVIEHVQDPVATLKICINSLKVDGIVGMLTPKIGGPAYKIHKAEWNGFRHGYHTFLFNGETLGRCMIAAGFEVLKSPRRDRFTDDILILWGQKRSRLNTLN